MVRFVSFVLAVALVSVVPAHAQSTATLQGLLTDAQGAVMPGVTVTIRNVATGIERTTVSDNAGQYVAASLPPGHYAVVAHLEGFKDQNGETDLGPAQTIVLNLKLGLGVAFRKRDGDRFVPADRYRDDVGRPGDGRKRPCRKFR